MSTAIVSPELQALHLITAEEVLKLFDISESTLAAWVARGVLPNPIRPGGLKRRRYWKPADIQAAIDRMAAG
jgi:DNA-binding transcriptional MerR regulator